MTSFTQSLHGTTYQFDGLVDLMAKATPRRSGDELAGCAAGSDAERAAAQWALADVPLSTFLQDQVMPYETDEVTRLIIDSHDRSAFGAVSHLTVGGFRDWLLDVVALPDPAATLSPLAAGLTPEMVAAVSKIMRNQDLIAVARGTSVISAFRTTIGLPGRLATRLQPNHPTDDPSGIAAATLDGLLLGCGDAVIGVNPASDSPPPPPTCSHLLDEIRQRFDIPTQSCVLAHVTTTLELIEAGVPVDLVFQSIAGTEGANSAFGVDISLLRRGQRGGPGAAPGHGRQQRHVPGDRSGIGAERGRAPRHRRPTGRSADPGDAGVRGGPAISSRCWSTPSSGSSDPEYLYDGKQIIRAGLEDHFCGKLLGLPMGVDVCYTNHAEADQDDMDILLTLLGAAGAAFVIAVPGADDVMLGYQSLSFHDVLYVRQVLGLRPAPEFESWLQDLGMADSTGRVLPIDAGASPLRQLTNGQPTNWRPTRSGQLAGAR